MCVVREGQVGSLAVTTVLFFRGGRVVPSALIHIAGYLGYVGVSISHAPLSEVHGLCPVVERNDTLLSGVGEGGIWTHGCQFLFVPLYQLLC